MNEYNHHRIIERFAASKKNINGAVSVPITNTLSDTDVQILKDASNYTDDFMGASKKREAGGTQNRFFLFHFYYDIKCENGTIVLQRNKKGDYRIHESMSRCDYDKEKYTEEKIDNSKLRRDSTDPPYTSIPNYKLFYTSINDREQYYANDLFKGENSNQSDCVAFLHAMRAQDESLSKAEEKFKEHLKSCFSEYLFIQNHEEALFMLGIAMHGIMDSFTPSHTNFQQYSNQHMGLHAQGDVIPIKGEFFKDKEKGGWKVKIGSEMESEEIDFVPANQDKEEGASGMLMGTAKGYNLTEYINDTEFEMLKIFLLISDITGRKSGYNYSREKKSRETFLQHFFGQSLSEIRKQLKGYKYGDNAYLFSEKAIETIEDIYSVLVKERQECLNNYSYYKDRKGKIIEEALSYWELNYLSFQLRLKEQINELSQLFTKSNFNNNGVKESLVDFMITYGNQQNSLDMLNPNCIL